MRSFLLTLFGIVTSLVYAAGIVWLYATQPRTLVEVATGAQVAAGTYRVDEARFQAALDLFQRQQYRAARDEWERADPARRDARTQFYVAYSYYREGWGRLRHDDKLYRQGVEAVDRSLSLASEGPLRVDDPDLGIQTAAELRTELQRGMEKSWSDLNPMRVLDRRK